LRGTADRFSCHIRNVRCRGLLLPGLADCRVSLALVKWAAFRKSLPDRTLSLAFAGRPHPQTGRARPPRLLCPRESLVLLPTRQRLARIRRPASQARSASASYGFFSPKNRDPRLDREHWPEHGAGRAAKSGAAGGGGAGGAATAGSIVRTGTPVAPPLCGGGRRANRPRFRLVGVAGRLRAAYGRCGGRAACPPARSRDRGVCGRGQCRAGRNVGRA